MRMSGTCKSAPGTEESEEEVKDTQYMSECELRVHIIDISSALALTIGALKAIETSSSVGPGVKNVRQIAERVLFGSAAEDPIVIKVSP